MNENMMYGFRDVNMGVRDFVGFNGGDLDVFYGEIGVDKSILNCKEMVCVVFDEVFFDRFVYYQFIFCLQYCDGCSERGVYLYFLVFVINVFVFWVCILVDEEICEN